MKAALPSRPPEPIPGYWSIRDPLPQFILDGPTFDLVKLRPMAFGPEVYTIPPDHFPLYQKLNRLLKPIRSPTMMDALSSRYPLESECLEEDETAKWLARFD